MPSKPESAIIPPRQPILFTFNFLLFTMLHLLLGFCIGLLPGLIFSTVFVRKLSSDTSALREHLAAEEASKRHFMQLGFLLNASLASWIHNFFTFNFPLFNCAYSAALMYQEQKRLEVELACRQAVSERIAA
jgi:hypothetical protein